MTSTAVTLMGISLLYGATGAVFLDQLAAAVATGTGPRQVLVVGALLLAGEPLELTGRLLEVALVDLAAGAPVESQSRARQGQLTPPTYLTLVTTSATRPQIEDRRRTSSVPRRPNSRVEDRFTQRVRVHGREEPARVRGVEQRHPVEVDARLVPGGATGPDGGGVVVAGVEPVEHRAPCPFDEPGHGGRCQADRMGVAEHMPGQQLRVGPHLRLGIQAAARVVEKDVPVPIEPGEQKLSVSSSSSADGRRLLAVHVVLAGTHVLGFGARPVQDPGTPPGGTLLGLGRHPIAKR